MLRKISRVLEAFLSDDPNAPYVIRVTGGPLEGYVNDMDEECCSSVDPDDCLLFWEPADAAMAIARLKKYGDFEGHEFHIVELAQAKAFV